MVFIDIYTMGAEKLATVEQNRKVQKI